MKNQNPKCRFCHVALICTLFFALFLPTRTYSQNYLMSEEHSSFHSGVELTYNTFENFYAAQAGYTHKGRLTLDFELGKTKDLANGINSTVFRPGIHYLILKQDEDIMPISLDINMGYQYNYLAFLNTTAKSLQFGVGLFHEVRTLYNVKIIPAALVEASKSTTGVNPVFDDSIYMSYGIQATLMWNNYYITPSFVSFDGVSTLGVKLGLIFTPELSYEVED